MSFWAKVAKDRRVTFLLEEGDRRRGRTVRWRASGKSMLRPQFRDAGNKQDRLIAAIVDRREWQR